MIINLSGVILNFAVFSENIFQNKIIDAEEIDSLLNLFYLIFKDDKQVNHGFK